MHSETARRLIALLVLPAALAVGEETTTPNPVGEPFAGAERLELPALVGAVLDRNPSLDAARHAWRAALERVPQATSWADPMLAGAVAPLSIGGGTMPLGARVEVRQRLPWRGRLELAGDAARAEAAVAGDRADEVALELAHLAADLYHRLYLVERSRAVNAEHVRLLGELKETATTRYAAGLAPQQAPLQAEVELTHVLHRDMDLATERQVLVAALNGLLHRPPSAPLPPAAELPERAVPPPVLAASGHHAVPPHGAASGHPATPAEELSSGPLPPRPELAALAAEIEARRLELELAELARYPDVELMTSYDSMFAGDHRWMVGLAVELPVRRARLRAAEAEAAALLAAAESRRQALAAEVRAEVAAAAAHLGHTVHVLELYRDRLGPASADQAQAARTGFETGQVDFATVIAAERNLRDVDLATLEARVERSRAQTALDRAEGRLPGAPEARFGSPGSSGAAAPPPGAELPTTPEPPAAAAGAPPAAGDLR